ncbi:response regulator [Paenibacillus thermotolerans]|uniref:response regulator n=1 Tax=Paenibacillus thermotolerans TaxID=3027807 RepID=UPI002367BB4C|nr:MULTISPECIES: response regulator [unclassified Paenibacillus]
MARIMVVDDAAFMRLIMKNIVTQYGHEVVAEAADGKIALKLYKQYKPDLVTMDVTMPEMDGIEALKEIMSFDKEANIVMCSSGGQQIKVYDAFRVGAKDYILKPFQEDRVLEAINRILYASI